MVYISSTTTGTIRHLPAQLLARLVIGQQIDLTVTKAVLAGEKFVLKIANELIELQTPVDLIQGQRIQLELVKEEGKPVLKLVLRQAEKLNQATQSIKNAQSMDSLAPASLKVGQWLSVQIVQRLAQNKLLAQLIVSNEEGTTQQFEIDTSQLKQSFRVGEYWWVKIVNTTPLQLQFLPRHVLSREQMISESIHRLSPLQGDLQQLSQFLSSAKSERFPQMIREAVDRLLAHTLEQSEVTDLSRFKRAISASGFMMEKVLMTKGSIVQGDFKANLNKVLQALETIINEIRGKVRQSEFNKLPSQVQEALLARGKTPVQLLRNLLSGYRLALAPSLSNLPLAPLIKSQPEALNLAQIITRPLTLAQDATSVAHKSVNISELIQLFKEIEGLQHKVVSNQLRMLINTDNNSTTSHWLFELPVKSKNELNLIQMQIDQFKEKEQEHDDHLIWNVKLRLDTQNLGSVQANIILNREDVKLVLKAERSDSAQLLNENLEVLHLAMNKLGISMSQSCCYCAPVDTATHEQKTGFSRMDKSLVDIRI